MVRILRVLVLFALAFLPLASSWAKEGDGGSKGGGDGTVYVYPWAKFEALAGMSYTGLDSGIRIGVTQGTGVTINIEDTLGLDTSLLTFRGDASWRFTKNRRHRFDFSYVGYFRNATRVLQEDIEIEDDVILAGTTVETDFNISIIKTLYSWSFLQDERLDMGFGGGFYFMPVDFKMSGTTASGTPIDTKAEAFTAPLPSLYFRTDVLIVPKLYLRQQVDFFYLAINEYRGGMLDIGVSLEYRFWKYTGVGLGYEGFRLNVEADNGGSSTSPENAQMNLSYNGLLFYAKFYY